MTTREQLASAIARREAEAMLERAELIRRYHGLVDAAESVKSASLEISYRRSAANFKSRHCLTDAETVRPVRS